MQSEPVSRPAACPSCGSSNLRRSMPRTAFERLMRAFTPYHYFLCRDCEYRGVRVGPLSSSQDGGTTGIHHPSRPLEPRDRQATRQRIYRTVLSVLFALALGAASGVYIHGCRERSQPADGVVD